MIQQAKSGDSNPVKGAEIQNPFVSSSAYPTRHLSMPSDNRQCFASMVGQTCRQTGAA
jgi:hypothetical protein